MKKFSFLIIIISFSFFFGSQVNAARIVKPLPAPNSGLIGYWNFDSCDAGKTCSPNVKDLSGRGNNGTWVSNASTTAHGKLKNGVGLDGVDDYINLGNPLDITGLGTNSFTVCTWLKTSATGARKEITVFGAPTASNQAAMFFVNASNKLELDLAYSAGPQSAITVTDGNWHLGCVRNSAGTIQIYVDGVASGSSQGMSPTLSSGLAVIGEYFDGTTHTYRFNGSLDEIRFYKRAINTTEIQNLYKEGLGSLSTPKQTSDTGLVGYWDFDSCDAGKTCTPNVKDLSGKRNNGTWAGQASTTAHGKLKNGVGLDGSGDYVDIPDSNDWNFGAGDFTIGAWVKANSFSVAGTIAGQASAAAIYQLLYINTSGQIHWDAQNGGARGPNMTGTTVMTVGNWYYVSITRVGSNWALYVNGKSDAPGSSSDTLPDIGTSLNIGSAQPQYPALVFNGTIDDVRVYKGRGLSAAEIQNLYKQGLGRINKSATPQNSGLVGYWNFDSCDAGKTCTPNVKDLSGKGSDGTWGGSGAAITASGKLGNGGSFGGAGYLDMSDAKLPLGSSARTISAWIKITTGTDWRVFWKYGTAGTPNGRMLWAGVSTLGDITITNYGEGMSSSGVNVKDGVWHNIVVWNDGTTSIKIYIDGVQRGSGTMTLNTVSANARIGNSNGTGQTGLEFNGTIDEVRFYNRALSATEINNLYQQGR